MSHRTKVMNLMHDTAGPNVSMRHWVPYVAKLREKGETDTQILDRFVKVVENCVERNQKALDEYYVYLKEENII